LYTERAVNRPRERRWADTEKGAVKVHRFSRYSQS
jgi:hypothetical protein